ncbi:hypothetical protein EHM69_04910 [candidate division KSB1 bacterium]|nr:MAG: hypothetical protein EHM69_04910 [candidate division KSB1 bacterium]
MYKYILIAILGMAVEVCAEPHLTRESHFFGIPNVDSLSNDFFLDISDTSDVGFYCPSDIELIRHRRDLQRHPRIV